MPECRGPFAGGRTPTTAQLDDILFEHAAWLRDGRPEGDRRRADLCESVLTEFESGIDTRSAAELAADRIIDEVLGRDPEPKQEQQQEPRQKWRVSPDLSHANLVRTNLAGSDFHSVPMAGAQLTGANLKKAGFDHADLSNADLHGADLRDASFEGANLGGADLDNALLSGADFAEADLSHTDLVGVDLTRTKFPRATMAHTKLCGQGSKDTLSPDALIGADLSWATLEGCNLSGFVMIGTTMVGTRLQNVDFTDAMLSSVDFTESKWDDVSIAGADVGRANFRNVFYDHRIGELPDLDSMRYALNLHELLYRDSPQSLLALRDGFLRAGMRNEERKVNHAVNRSRRILDSGPVEAAFNFVLFEVTVGYGLWPGRPLKIVAILIPIFATVYFFALRFPGADGIWREWDSGRVRKDLGTDRQTLLRLSTGPAIRAAAYFSILSAFHIGWRDLNVGSWIQRIQPREYLLRASGWVRTVAGIQSLISVYLLALWLVSYFGRPFIT